MQPTFWKLSQETIKKLKIWLFKQEISFILYYISILLLVFGNFIFSKNTLIYIVTILILIAVVWDLINMALKYKNKTLGILFLFFSSILIYFVNIQAESLAYTTITTITGEKAEYFPIVSSFFQGIYTPLALILLIIKNFIYFFIITLFVGILIPIIAMAIQNKLDKKFIHLFLFTVSIYSLLFYSFNGNIDKIYKSFFGENYQSKKIIEYSYYKNTNCQNIEGYIHFLYKDIISVTNVKDLNYSNGLEVVFIKNTDKNITFSTQKCIRKEKVDLSIDNIK